jgi:hypothetical protein
MLGIPEDATPWPLLAPAADAAGRTSAYHSLKGAVRAWITCHINQGAANTVLLSPLQATAVAGTGSKAIAAARIWTKLDQAFTAYTKQTEAATFTTDAAVKDKIIVFELDLPKVLDVAGGFDCIAVSTGASAAGNITEATLWIQPAYHGTPGINPLAD